MSCKCHKTIKPGRTKIFSNRKTNLFLFILFVFIHTFKLRTHTLLTLYYVEEEKEKTKEEGKKFKLVIG